MSRKQLDLWSVREPGLPEGLVVPEPGNHGVPNHVLHTAPSHDLFLDRNLVLAAGAGSGKTHALVTVALGLYAGAGGRSPIDPSRVWAVTFTEKAAAELRQRVADRALRLARKGGDLGDEPELAAMLEGRLPLGSEWDRIARSLSAAPIGTFHSLCGQLLRGFAAEARLDPRFAVLDEKEAGLLFEQAREEIFLDELESGDRVHGLVAELGDLAALRDAIGFLHAKLAEEGRDPSSLLESPAFDLDDAQRRLALACASIRPALDLLAATDHPRLGPARQALEREHHRIGSCAVADLEIWYPAVAAIAQTSAGRGALPKDVKPVWDEVKTVWSKVQESYASCRQAVIARDLVAILRRVAEAFADEKRQSGALDFADLIRHTRDLLRDDHEVRREAKRRVQALLVDEFQDTNGLQLELVNLLAEARDQEREAAEIPVTGFPLEPAIFCAVGDRKQSIYEFRGADVSLFADLTTKAREAREGFRLHALVRSWRSRPGLVHFANVVFHELLSPATRPFEVGWFEGEDDLSPQRTDPESQRSVPSVQLLQGDPELDAANRRPFEAALVAEHVASMLRAGESVVEKTGHVRPLVGADIALLLRAFTHLPLYQQALAERGIPSLVVKGRRFHRAREIQDLAALLLVLCDPRDRLASAAVLRAPWVGISDDSLLLLHHQGGFELSRHVKGCTADLPGADADRVSWIAKLVWRLGREVDRLGPTAVLRLAIEEVGLLPMLAASFGGEQRLANVEKLLRRLEARPGISALALAEELLASASNKDDREAPADVAAGADPRAVRIMTVHASKGLEFPVVILPELGAGEPPNNSAVFFDRNLGLAIKPSDALRERLVDPHAQQVLDELKARGDAESRRLLYVAITRARDRLVLCGERGRGGANTWRGMLDTVLPSAEEWVELVPLPPTGVASSAGPNGSDDGGVEAVPAPPSSPTDGSVRHVSKSIHLAEGEIETAPSESVPPGSAAPFSSTFTGADTFLSALLQQVQPPVLKPSAFVAAVTELGELARCERRYFYRTIAGLEEHGSGDPFDPLFDAEESTGLDRLARGELAHRLLECADLERIPHEPTEALDHVLAQEGLDPNEPEIASIRDDVETFFRGSLGQALLSTPPERIFRELPFGLEVQSAEGIRLAIRGQIDLLFIDDQGRINLIDYKHAKASGQSLDAYAFQLRTYALAAYRIIPGAAGLQAGIAWLRDRGAEADLLPIDRDVCQQHEKHLASLGDTLARARREKRWARLDEPSACGDCGFRFRCWGAR